MERKGVSCIIFPETEEVQGNSYYTIEYYKRAECRRVHIEGG